MAKNNKKIKSSDEEYIEYRQRITETEYENILNLILNSVKIKNLEEYIPEDIVKRWLFELGRVAVLQLNDKVLFALCDGVGVDAYGRPTQYTILTQNGKTWSLSVDDPMIKGILYIQPNKHGIFEYLYQRCEELAYVRLCMQNNLIATENQIVYECNDIDTVNKMKIAYKKREIGMPVIFSSNADKSFVDGVNVLGKDIPFIADKLLAMYTNIRNEILEHYGILAGNTDKKERVQVGEIQSQVGYVIDNIYMFIETFNYFSKINNLPYEMTLNSTVESLYGEYLTTQGVEDGNETNN